MREARKRQGGCDLQVAKSSSSSSVWWACFIQQEAAEGADQSGMDGFVPAVGQGRERQRDRGERKMKNNARIMQSSTSGDLRPPESKLSLTPDR